MYLFQPRRQPAEPSEADGELLDPPRAERAALASPALQPGSAAEWALGELLIRLCNGGRSLRAEDDGPQ